jgi:predicted nucleic-acid-binding protein
MSTSKAPEVIFWVCQPHPPGGGAAAEEVTTILTQGVIVRYLTESSQDVDAKFEGVFGFFEKLEAGSLSVFLPDLVLFQAYFVLTSFYRAPRSEVADKLRRIVEFSGIRMTDKNVIIACLSRLQSQNLDVVDCYLLGRAERGQLRVFF